MTISFSPAGGIEGSVETGPETQSGVVSVGDASMVAVTELNDGETLNISEATLILSDGSVAPSNLDLVIASLDGSGGGTLEVTIISGDGSTHFVNQSGDPLASHTNNTGSSQIVGVFVDNGEFGTGSGFDRDVQAKVVQTIET